MNTPLNFTTTLTKNSQHPIIIIGYNNKSFRNKMMEHHKLKIIIQTKSHVMHSGYCYTSLHNNYTQYIYYYISFIYYFHYTFEE